MSSCLNVIWFIYFSQTVISYSTSQLWFQIYLLSCFRVYYWVWRDGSCNVNWKIGIYSDSVIFYIIITPLRLEVDAIVSWLEFREVNIVKPKPVTSRNSTKEDAVALNVKFTCCWNLLAELRIHSWVVEIHSNVGILDNLIFKIELFNYSVVIDWLSVRNIPIIPVECDSEAMESFYEIRVFNEEVAIIFICVSWYLSLSRLSPSGITIFPSAVICINSPRIPNL